MSPVVCVAIVPGGVLRCERDWAGVSFRSNVDGAVVLFRSNVDGAGVLFFFDLMCFRCVFVVCLILSVFSPGFYREVPATSREWAVDELVGVKSLAFSNVSMLCFLPVRFEEVLA